jgi:glycosyltransferase involved in cell wall biosynthesis
MSSTPAATISIALVTRNRPESLRRCLKSWRSQSVQPFEIVISDDSNDPHQAEMQQIAAEFGARWIAGPRRGLYANRNHVAAHCRGAYIFSADDDHEHPVDLMEKCLAALRKDPQAAWCLGEVNSWEQIPEGWGVPGELGATGGSDMPGDLSNTWAWSDGAALCPRGVFDSGLAFTEAFRFGASYLEFGCLLHATGRRIRILEGIGVVHHAQQVGRSFVVPVEECAAGVFAMLMFAFVYQPTKKNQVQVLINMLKQTLRYPVRFMRAFPWAVREKRRRTRWFRQWQAAHGGRNAHAPL